MAAHAPPRARIVPPLRRAAPAAVRLWPGQGGGVRRPRPHHDGNLNHLAPSAVTVEALLTEEADGPGEVDGTVAASRPTAVAPTCRRSPRVLVAISPLSDGPSPRVVVATSPAGDGSSSAPIDSSESDADTSGAIDVPALRRAFDATVGEAAAGSGKTKHPRLQRSALQPALVAAGESVSEDEVGEVLALMGVKHASLDFADVVALVRTVRVRRLFREVDTDGSGTLDRDEVAGLLAAADVPASEAEALIATADADGDGAINFQEFYQVFAAHAGAELSQLPRLWRSEAGLTVDAIKKAFEKVDRNHHGVLSRRQLLRAMNEGGEATTEAVLDALLELMAEGEHTGGGTPAAHHAVAARRSAHNADAEVFSLTDAVALTRTRRLQRMFASIDTSGDGHVDRDELRLFLREALDVDVSAATLDAMLDTADADNDGQVSFAEFHSLFAAHAGADVRKLSRLWMSMAVPDIGGDFSVVPAPKSVPLWQFILAGGMGGAMARTLTAPLERLKIMQQAPGPTAGESTTLTVRALARDVLAKEGVRGLWAGNMANLLKVFPFVTYSHFLNYFPVDREFDIMEAFYRGIAGALAGACATTVTYPLDLVRARQSVAEAAQRSGVFGTMRIIVAKEGARALFKGFTPTLAAIAPFLAVQQSSYDVMRKLSAPHVEPSLPLFAIIGAAAGICAQTLTHPLDTLRRRMQLATHHMHDARGVLTALTRTMMGGGLRGTYAGWGVATAKVVPAVAVGIVVRDALLGRHITDKDE